MNSDANKVGFEAVWLSRFESWSLVGQDNRRASAISRLRVGTCVVILQYTAFFKTKVLRCRLGGICCVVEGITKRI